MIYVYLYSWWPDLNLLQYTTLRTMGAFLTALFFCLFYGRNFISWLKGHQGAGQPIRSAGPESHLKTKQGTPTMGGVLILSGLLCSTLLWGNLANPYLLVLIGTTVSFSCIGVMDDYMKLTKRSSSGLKSRHKFFLQLLCAVVIVYSIQSLLPIGLQTTLMIPMLRNFSFDLGVFFIPFAMVVLVGSSNAVNLTDGLDGLAIGPVIIATSCFALITYLVGQKVCSDYLHISFVPSMGEISIFCGALIGASLGFLWFNAPPATVFMGDTGSLSIGAALGAMSIMTKQELVWATIGGVFVLEAVSVILQVLYFKLSGGRRIFLMAPLHHHFEKKGWSEPTVVIRFWIIAVVLAIVGLATLKLR